MIAMSQHHFSHPQSLDDAYDGLNAQYEAMQLQQPHQYTTSATSRSEGRQTEPSGSSIDPTPARASVSSVDAVQTRSRALSSPTAAPRNFSRPSRMSQQAPRERQTTGESVVDPARPVARQLQYSPAPEASTSRAPVASTSYFDPRQPTLTLDTSQQPRRDRNKSVSSQASSVRSHFKFFGRKSRTSRDLDWGSPTTPEELLSPSAPMITLSSDGHAAEPLGVGEGDFERVKRRQEAENLAREDEDRKRRALAEQRLAQSGMRLAPDTAMEHLSDTEQQRSRSRSPSVAASDFSLYSFPPDLPTPTTPMEPSRTMMKAQKSLNALKAPPKQASPGRGASPGRKKDAQPNLNPNDPNDCLQLGIECHERGEMAKSAYFFERSATISGGIGSGMLMWGLSLRQGWGCAVNQEAGFAFIQRAAESVVSNLDQVIASVESEGSRQLFATEQERMAAAAKSELVLSIFELGESFAHGMGTKRDKAMALRYFQLAASLGDADAQQECGFRYLHGKGCKKDRKKAAHFYRLAARQGAKSFGMSWIDADKYASD